MKSEKDVLIRENANLKKQNQVLEKRFSREQRYENKNTEIVSDLAALNLENVTLQRQVNELNNSLIAASSSDSPSTP